MSENVSAPGLDKVAAGVRLTCANVLCGALVLAGVVWLFSDAFFGHVMGVRNDLLSFAIALTAAFATRPYAWSMRRIIERHDAAEYAQQREDVRAANEASRREFEARWQLEEMTWQAKKEADAAASRIKIEEMTVDEHVAAATTLLVDKDAVLPALVHLMYGIIKQQKGRQ